MREIDITAALDSILEDAVIIRPLNIVYVSAQKVLQCKELRSVFEDNPTWGTPLMVFMVKALSTYWRDRNNLKADRGNGPYVQNFVRAVVNLEEVAKGEQPKMYELTPQAFNPCNQSIVPTRIPKLSPIGEENEDNKQLEEGRKGSIPGCTCNDCPDNESCKFAFDPYNTNGDCLADK